MAQIVLVGVTLPLWTTIDRFPAIPLLPQATAVPVFVDRILVVLMCVASGWASWLLLKGGRNSASGIDHAESPQWLLQALLATAVIAGTCLCVLNQQRLQAWHWLFLTILLQRLTVQKCHRSHVFRKSVACVYLFAALSRFGPEVDDGMSRQMLIVLADIFGAQSVMQHNSLVTGMCLAMSLFELTVGVTLFFDKSRRIGVIGAVMVHAVLLLTLSPLGLNHHYGVLAWNACLLLLIPLLCWPATAAATDQQLSSGQKLFRWSASAWIVFILAIPASGLLGLADNWLSWQLYSPRPEIVRIFVRQDVVNQLPAAVRSVTGPPALLDEWCPVRIDRWSLLAVQSPVYPEDRFQLGVAAWLANQLSSPDAIRIEIEQPSFPAWWRRERIPIPAERITEFTSNRFFWNSTELRVP